MKPKRTIMTTIVAALIFGFADAANYTVQTGDTLYRISTKLGVAAELLQQLNQLTNTNLKVGQVLLVPDKHSIAKGETLFAIAKKYGVSMEAIRDLNKLESDALKPGQTLLIPPTLLMPPRAAQAPTTQAPQTQTLVASTGTTKPTPKPAPTTTAAPTTAAANDAKNTTTNNNQTFIATNEEKAAEVATPINLPQLSGPIDTQPLSAPIVQKPTEAQLPNLGLPEITPTETNQATVSPTVTSNEEIFHVVAAGENLFRIATKYGVGVETIRQANNLSTDALAVGQRLKIPVAGNANTVNINLNAVNTNSAPSASSTTNTTTVNPGRTTAVRDIAKKYLGVPYQWGGTTTKGLDCSGFVMVVYNELGVQLPHSSKLLFATGVAVTRENLREGDLVFFETTGEGVSHVGIYLSDGQFIHAATYPSEVTISNLNEKYWAPKYLGARRIE